MTALAFASQLGSGPPLLVAGIGEMVFSTDPDALLVAYGLGSCVGLSAWDPQALIGGLAHFMLPAGPAGKEPVKCIAGGLQQFLETFTRQGGRVPRAHFKAAGGAAMLSILSGGLEIGRRNGEAISAGLSAAGLALRASALGGTAGRTVQLEVGTGRLLIKSVSAISVL